jgi:hypothetical protein
LIKKRTMNETFLLPTFCSDFSTNEQLFKMSIEFWKENQENNKKTFLTSIVISVVPILGMACLIAIILFIASRIFTIRKLYRRRVNNVNLKIFENFLMLIAELDDTAEPYMNREQEFFSNKIRLSKSKTRKYSNREIFIVENEFKRKKHEEKTNECEDELRVNDFLKPNTSRALN